MFNSCQGLTFDSVVIDGRTDVFAHGQLYTALSRVRNRADAWFYLPDDRPDLANVVYEKLLM
jgi:ATP-dependent exoDNAse (exonuclease V) alpha subunit